jgi:hypothetical protein
LAEVAVIAGASNENAPILVPTMAEIVTWSDPYGPPCEYAVMHLRLVSDIQVTDEQRVAITRTLGERFLVPKAVP